jgi:hypothetical protein
MKYKPAFSDFQASIWQRIDSKESNFGEIGMKSLPHNLGNLKRRLLNYENKKQTRVSGNYSEALSHSRQEREAHDLG